MQPNSPRIALITGGVPLGGSTTLLCNLGGELQKRALPHIVLSFEQHNPMHADFARLGVNLHLCQNNRLVFEECMRQILKQLEAFAPTCVVACLGANSFEVLRYIPAGITRLGMVQSDEPGLYELLEMYSEWLDGTIGVSRLIAEKLQATPKLLGKPAHYLTCGIPMDRLNTPREVTDRLAPIRILYLGRLEQEQKRVRLFPQILAQLQAKNIPFQWTIAGEGSQRAFLEREMQCRGTSSQVQFTGHVAYADVPALLKRHDVYLLASDYEGLPLSLLEAMACGVVPVVSDLESGIRDLVSASTGIAVPVNDIDAYADAILQLHLNRGELHQKSIAAQQRVAQEFSVEAMTDRWLTVAKPNQPEIYPVWKESKILTPIGYENHFRFTGAGLLLRKLRKRISSKS